MMAKAIDEIRLPQFLRHPDGPLLHLSAGRDARPAADGQSRPRRAEGTLCPSRTDQTSTNKNCMEVPMQKAMNRLKFVPPIPLGIYSIFSTN
jgi:hypothetical protein